MNEHSLLWSRPTIDVILASGSGRERNGGSAAVMRREGLNVCQTGSMNIRHSFPFSPDYCFQQLMTIIRPQYITVLITTTSHSLHSSLFFLLLALLVRLAVKTTTLFIYNDLSLIFLFSLSLSFSLTLSFPYPSTIHVIYLFIYFISYLLKSNLHCLSFSSTVLLWYFI